MEAQCKDGVRADGVALLIVETGERRGLLGVGSREHDAFLGHELRGPLRQGLGVVASRWLGGGNAKAQGRGETIETNWSRDGLRHKSDNLRRCCRL